jgi:hypothetical protein
MQKFLPGHLYKYRQTVNEKIIYLPRLTLLAHLSLQKATFRPFPTWPKWPIPPCWMNWLTWPTGPTPDPPYPLDLPETLCPLYPEPNWPLDPLNCPTWPISSIRSANQTCALKKPANEIGYGHLTLTTAPLFFHLGGWNLKYSIHIHIAPSKKKLRIPPCTQEVRGIKRPVKTFDAYWKTKIFKCRNYDIHVSHKHDRYLWFSLLHTFANRITGGKVWKLSIAFHPKNR